MPSHITHALCALETRMRLNLPVIHSSWYILGSQGPDMFLHNRRRYPNTVSWGRRIHQEGYGRFVNHLGTFLHERGLGWDTPPGMFLQGYITHAVLDRKLHPYIHAASYRSGSRHLLLHPFLERLIDIELLESRPGISLKEPFSRNVDLGEHIPDLLTHMLEYGAERFGFTSPEPAGLRISNAYRDTRDLLMFTDQLGTQQLHMVFQRDDPEARKRVLSLFHPPEVPLGLDVLNRSGISWPHPWEEGVMSKEGVDGLYGRAVVQAAEILNGLLADPPGTYDISEAVGNENLNGSLSGQRPPTLRDSWLALEEAVEIRYRELERLSINDDLVQ